uniref:Ig-like domain-containing protein n=1 Tax=Pygocentrus nattereri TaxID=42514 RepID=A0A3B4CTH5_PYGNA
MITVLTAFCIFVSVQTSGFDDLRVQAVKYKENVTIKCEQSFVKGHKHYLAWYKQSFGKLPQFIARAAKHNEDARYARPFVERFRLTATEETFDLKIMNTVEEDTGTYFCVKVKEYVTEFGSGILLLFPDEKSEKRNLTEVDVKSGESVTLQCSVAPLSCSGDHSVYWFRHGSGEPHPGIIYTRGDTDSRCTRSSETDSPTQSCVYKLPKRNLSLSDAGTYYCAVAACGQMLFGSGTNLCIKGDNSQTVIALATSNVITVIVTVILAVLLLKNQWKGSFNDHPNHTNQVANTDALNYAALNFAMKPRPFRTSRVKECQDIYSQVKVQ